MGKTIRSCTTSTPFLMLLQLLLFFLAAAPAMGASIFLDDSLVRERCGACHKPVEEGRLEVIEENRKSPEEWKNVLIRMMRLNGLPLEDALFDPIVKELSDKLPLTPAEMASVAYYNSDENSQYREIPKDETEKRIYGACVRCHTYAKIASHRMTPAGWEANRDLHLGYYPTVVPQMREMDWVKESKELIPVLAEKFPFESEEWRKWMADRKKPDMAGAWRVVGYQPGYGYYTGEYEFTAAPDAGEDVYRLTRRVTYENGASLAMSGNAALYGDYHLRYALSPTPLTGRLEGVFDLDAETGTFTGKWWTVVQDSNGFGNEVFGRTDGKAAILGVFPHSIPAGAESNLTVVGVGLPENPGPADFGFSDPAVKVVRVETGKSGHLRCSVAAGDIAAPVQLKMGDVSYSGPIIVYDRIDAIRILPRIGRARVSCGAAYPPQGVQFVARGVHFGPDGKPDTADDMLLEPVAAQWQLEEEPTRKNDDDLKYLDAPIDNGLYTPVTTYGPIQERQQHREGIGLIAVTAGFSVDGKKLTDRAMLGVTVPDFITHIK